jgi:putative transposase
MYEYRSLSEEQRADLVEQRRHRGFPPHSPPHTIRDEALYLITAACYEHMPHLVAPQRRNAFLDLLFDSFISASIGLHAWVVGPNHYHLLVEPVEFTQIGRVLHYVHVTTARSWNAEDGETGRAVWYRYSDRAIRSEAHFLTTLNYIHYNPVKHGWSKLPYDWNESSVHWYLACFGRQWLRDLWTKYPLRAYGKDWDEDAPS